jgi:DNA processing protein
MTDDTTTAWYTLFRTRGVGPKALAAIQRDVSRAGRALCEVLNQEASQDVGPALAKFITSGDKRPDAANIQRELDELRAAGVEIIHPEHTDAPAALIDMAQQFGISPVLFTRGQTSLLTAPGVGIVGSRDVSTTGIDATRSLAARLAGQGINIVSGYAKGVDTESHLGALASGGTTTAVLSHGILEFSLRREMRPYSLERGILAVSQFQPWEGWKARNAMMRNKLVCGLADAVVVIQSGPEKDSRGRMSGTFDAGRSALKMGKPLFVLAPDCFTEPPAGNAELIDLGGTAFTPENGVSLISDELSTRRTSGQQKPSQAELF